MAERYERDEYSFQEYSENSINVGCACSWSVKDILGRRGTVRLITPDGFVFDSDRATWLSDERLRLFADRLRQVEAGAAASAVRRPGAWHAQVLRARGMHLGQFLKGPQTLPAKLVDPAL